MSQVGEKYSLEGKDTLCMDELILGEMVKSII